MLKCEPTAILVGEDAGEAPLSKAIQPFFTTKGPGLDFAVLYGRGQLFLCAVYVGVSVLCSISALFAGMLLFRRLLSPII